MTRTWIVGLVLLAAWAGSGQTAEAACTASDAKGRWNVFSIWTDQAAAGWTACRLKADGSGTVTGGQCDFSTGGSASISSGRLRVATNCAVTGSIGFDGERSVVDQAQMTRDKLVIEGVGHDTTGAIFRFSAVRR